MENGGAKNERRSCNRCLLSESKKQGRKERQLLWLLLLTECRRHTRQTRNWRVASQSASASNRANESRDELSGVVVVASTKTTTRRDDSPRSISPNAPPFTFHTRLTSEKQREKNETTHFQTGKKRFTTLERREFRQTINNKKTLPRPKTRS